MNKQLKATSAEKKKYALPTKADFEILAKCKKLEKLKLASHDKFFVKFIKTQLEKNWRKPLLKELNKLLKKYRK